MRAVGLALVVLLALPVVPALTVSCLDETRCLVTIEGRVLDELGDPAHVCVNARTTDARAAAFFVDGDISGPSTTTQPDGTYRIEVLPGSWRLETNDIFTDPLFANDPCGPTTSHYQFVHQRRTIEPLAGRQDFTLEYNVMRSGDSGGAPGDLHALTVYVGSGAAEGGAVRWVEETSGEVVTLADAATIGNDLMHYFTGQWTIPADRAEGIYPARLVVRDAQDRLVEDRVADLHVDATPPSLLSVSPAEGATVARGDVAFAVTAEDNLRLDRVHVVAYRVVDGVRQGQWTSNVVPFLADGSASGTLRISAAGTYDLRFHAYDHASNRGVAWVRIGVQ